MCGKPEELYANFDKEGLSHFITEKFGTATFIAPTPPLMKGGRSTAQRSAQIAETGDSNITKNKKLFNEPPLS
ncbi:MAG: hypothetical protein LBI53_03730 [Candidatus Peribacteria bacterium]|jgi:hypothetical protein|nr:hypothetical protein [Candidatus Peribacteria bacterium]